ncbi:hypothetical protein ANN_26221 [Periplaneta americana]|uniref:Uncharacterized protein n=1 Tax=Periplaneta americana TaxID=6978 RepID=A0ABQ8S5P6_PERAM|nr:hypothetical protein ANN_26221 [Periplaneta americana]
MALKCCNDKKDIFKADDSDISSVTWSQILQKLSMPDLVGSEDRQKYQFKDEKSSTVPKLLPIIRSKITFHWGSRSLNRLLKTTNERSASQKEKFFLKGLILPPPNKYATNAAMIEWLEKKGIQEIGRLRSHSALPPTLYVRVKCSGVGLGKDEKTVRENNVRGDMSLSALRELTNKTITSVINKDWEDYCSHVLKVEAGYWKKHRSVSEITDTIIINLGEDSSSSSSGSDSDSDSDSESDSKNDGSESNSGNESQDELATPL